MKVVSLDEMKFLNNSEDGWDRFDIFAPSFFNASSMNNLRVYEVQKGEEMRIDLVMSSIYDEYTLGDLDVILYINGIDNPLNIREGMLLSFPDIEALVGFRYYDNGGHVVSKSIKSQLGVLNKTMRKDENRKKFLDSNYSLPPTVMKESNPSVRVSGGTIFVGGI